MSDAVWKELAEVSLALGHSDEAVRCAERISDARLRAAVEAYLFRRRKAGHVAAPAGARAYAPGASRGPAPRADEPFDPADEEPRVTEHMADAVQFLFVQHMPWLGLLTTLAFPLVIGLGGFLTAGTSMLGLAAISALPGAGVIGLVCAMSRRILVEASRGAIDPPGFPDVRTLAKDAWRFCSGAALVLSIFATPAAGLALLGVPTLHVATVGAVGALLAPMAFVLSQLYDARTALAPRVLLPAVTRGGLSYLGLAGLCWALLLPLALVAISVVGQPIWVQIAALGPAAVLPVFVTARLCGTWSDVKLHRLEPIVGRRRAAARAPTAKVRGVTANTADGQAEQRVQRPATPRRVRSAAATRQPARPARPTPRAIEGRGPQRPAQPQPRPQPRPQPQPQPQPRTPAEQEALRQQLARQRMAQHLAEQMAQEQEPTPEPTAEAPPSSDLPDLSGLPGATLYTGRARITSGAAARPR